MPIDLETKYRMVRPACQHKGGAQRSWNCMCDHSRVCWNSTLLAGHASWRLNVRREVECDEVGEAGRSGETHPPRGIGMRGVGRAQARSGILYCWSRLGNSRWCNVLVNPRRCNGVETRRDGRTVSRPCVAWPGRSRGHGAHWSADEDDRWTCVAKRRAGRRARIGRDARGPRGTGG
jgi:hypothetical protein